MEKLGDIEIKANSENYFSCEWNFNKVVFNNSYRSLRVPFLQNTNISALQLAIVPDRAQNIVRFFSFLYGCEKSSGLKMTCKASLIDESKPKYYVSCSYLYHVLETSTEIFEIHSAHPILFNCDEYTFKFELNIHKDSILTSIVSNSNLSIEDIKEDKKSSNSSKEESEKVQCLEYGEDLIQDLRSLYISGDMSDLEIHIGNDILHAHKLILCTRSPVFKKMMEGDYAESLSNSITISDFTTPQFEQFLKFIYTGKIEVSTMNNLLPLYSLGDKYNVHGLCEGCFEILESKFSSESVEEVAENVCDIFLLADSHGDLKLKDLATSFIIKHFSLLSNKQNWKDLMKSNFELTSEILALVASSLHKQVNGL